MKYEKVTWRGTPGVGDFMWALNSCHNHAHRTNREIRLEMHWEHDENHYHHFEDPETIIERMEYIHNFYHNQSAVEVNHVFNSNGRYNDWKYTDEFGKHDDGRTVILTRSQNKNRFWFESGDYTDTPGSDAPDNNWMFRRNAFREIKRNKIVIWHHAHNAEVPRTWKRFLTFSDWNGIIDKLANAGLDIVELTYRTPVAEAMYHISTCRQIICYDGMWHYIGRNFARPMLVCSTEGITKYHTPHCVRAHHDKNKKHNIHWWVDNYRDMLGHTKKKAALYENKMKEFIK